MSVYVHINQCMNKSIRNLVDIYTLLVYVNIISQLHKDYIVTLNLCKDNVLTALIVGKMQMLVISNCLSTEQEQ